MTYNEVVERVREVFEYADARNVFEHIAIQVNIIGDEACGIFYFEVAGRQISVEPYDYYDRDGILTTTAATLIDMCDDKITIKEAYEKGLVKFEGDLKKFNICLTNIIIK